MSGTARGRNNTFRGYHGNRGKWWRGKRRGGSRDNGVSSNIDDSPPKKKPHLIQTTLLAKCPYIHWNIYLPTQSIVIIIFKLISHYIQHTSVNPIDSVRD